MAGDPRAKVIETFFDGDTLLSIPAKRSKKGIIFEEILRRLPPPRSDGSYTERQLSKHIERHHSDFCTIRREFIMGRYMTRERGRYRLTPRGEAVVPARSAGATWPTVSAPRAPGRRRGAARARGRGP